MRQHTLPKAVTLETFALEARSALIGSRWRAPRRTGRACSHYVQNLRRRIGQNLARPCHQIAAILLADVASGTPLDDLLAFPHRLEAMIRAAVRERDRECVLSIHEANDREFELNQQQDAYQWLVAQGDLSHATLQALHAATVALRRSCMALEAAIERTLYVERAS